MAETKRRRTSLDRALDRVKGFKVDIKQWVHCYARHGETFEFFMNWREKRIFNHVDWKKLPAWATKEVMEYFDYIFWDARDSTLVSTSVYQGKRWVHGEKILNEARLVYEEEKKLEAEGKAAGCWCYAFCDTRNGNRLILVPYREEDRKKELESGRLSQADLDSLWDREVIQLQHGNKLNGRQCLTMRIQVPIENGIVEMPPPGSWTNLFPR